MQLLTAVYVPDKTLSHAPWIVTGIAILSVVVALVWSWPRRSLRRDFTDPEMTIHIKVANIFDQTGQIVVGFADTFDTDVSNDKIISSLSLQGAMLAQVFEGNVARLDGLLDGALSGITPVDRTAPTKPGKHERYPIGTIAVLEPTSSSRIYCLAYTHMGDNLVAKASIHDLWAALNQLWDVVYVRGSLEPITLPLMGSQLARIQCVDRETLLRMILISFVARAREQQVSRQLTIAVTESDWLKMNPVELGAFLSTL